MKHSRVRRIYLALAGFAIVLVSIALSLAPSPAYADSTVLPVLLVHGHDGWGNSKSDWVNDGWIADGLREVGHGSGWAVYTSAMQTSAHKVAPGIFDTAPVYSLDYHGYHDAKGPLKQNAGILAKALDVVTKDSGATDVYVVAHSQGGLMTRAVMEGLALDPQDGSAIPYKNNIFGFMTIDTPHKGSSSSMVDLGKQLGDDAAKDMVSGSAFLRELNAGSISEATFCSVAVGNAMGEAGGDDLFSVDEQEPVDGTVPSSTEIREFAVVHGHGMFGINYNRYTAATASSQVKDWAIARYREALKAYQQPNQLLGTPPAKRSLRTATALVMDVSGSMGDTWQGGVKIDSAKNAADELVSVIDGQAQQSNFGDQISVSSFSDSAQSLIDSTSDYSAVRQAIQSLAPQNSTNIGDGITTGLQQIEQAPPGVERIMVLLSDGENNTGMTNDEVFSGPVQDAANAGVKIFTIGFGDPGDIDEQFLQQVADRTGGEYFPASDAIQLANTYIRIGVTSQMPHVWAELSGTVSQGQLAQAGSFDVTATVGQMEAVLNWPGSIVDLQMKDPSGSAVTSSYPGLTASGSARPRQLFIANPMKGTWSVGVYGAQVSGAEPYYVLVASQEPTVGSLPVAGASADSSWFLVALMALGFTGAGAWVFVSSKKAQATGASDSTRETTEYPEGEGFFLIGDAGERFRLRMGLTSVGRCADNDIVVDSGTVSRYHAVIDCSGPSPVMTDLNSTRGTFKNGKRVQEAGLLEKDAIGFGDVRMILRRAGGKSDA